MDESRRGETQKCQPESPIYHNIPVKFSSSVACLLKQLVCPVLNKNKTHRKLSQMAKHVLALWGSREDEKPVPAPVRCRGMSNYPDHPYALFSTLRGGSQTVHLNSRECLTKGKLYPTPPFPTPVSDSLNLTLRQLINFSRPFLGDTYSVDHISKVIVVNRF